MSSHDAEIIELKQRIEALTQNLKITVELYSEVDVSYQFKATGETVINGEAVTVRWISPSFDIEPMDCKKIALWLADGLTRNIMSEYFRSKRFRELSEEAFREIAKDLVKNDEPSTAR